MGLYSNSYRPRKIYPSEGRVKQALSFDLHGLVKRGVITSERARELRRLLQSPGSSDGVGKTTAIAQIDNLIAKHPHLGRAPRRPRGRFKSGATADRGHPWGGDRQERWNHRSVW